MGIKCCENCVFFNPETSMCQYCDKEVTPFKFACPHYATEVTRCEICGRGFVAPRTFLMEKADSEEYMLICPSCSAKHGHCETCKESAYCAFRDDTECQLPHMVKVQRQQGPMTIIQEAPNPARIEATCKVKCKCYNAEYNGCCRGLGSCINFEVRKVDRNV